MPIRKTIYLDYNATTPLLPNVREAMLDIMDIPLNPSSIHGYGRLAKSIMEVARSRVAHLAGCDDRYQVIFTASGTEASCQLKSRIASRAPGRKPSAGLAP